MKPQIFRDQEGNIINKFPPNIPTKYKSTASFSRDQYPVCLACKLATAKAKSTDVVTNRHISGKEGAISSNLYEPSDFIATDQFIVKNPGRVQKGYGREAAQNVSHGRTIFQDTASNIVRV